MNEMTSVQSRENRAFAYEVKFLVPSEQALKVREWARAWMNPDPNSATGTGDGYRITSLYYDTEQFDVFHKNGSGNEAVGQSSVTELSNRVAKSFR